MIIGPYFPSTRRGFVNGRAQCWGVRAFTLIELLTVIAIIGILATLLMSALATARKKSQVVVSISNLRQIALGFTLYRDDYGRRPRHWDALLSSGNLENPQILRCPADRQGNWGNVVQPGPVSRSATNSHSYLYPLPWEDWAWNRIVQSGAHAGLAACQLHGVGRPDPEFPSMRDYEGLVLRAQLDGAVVKREIFWNLEVSQDSALSAVDASVPEMGMVAEADAESFRTSMEPDRPWALFMDAPIEP